MATKSTDTSREHLKSVIRYWYKPAGGASVIADAVRFIEGQEPGFADSLGSKAAKRALNETAPQAS